MYVPPYFARNDGATAIDFIRRHPFGIIIGAADGGIRATHAPFVILRDRDPFVLGFHLAKANPQSVQMDGMKALAIFHGPHAMVSASWYGDPRLSVPTWNYEAVHCRGTAARAGTDVTRDILRRLVDEFDPAWSLDGADADYIARMEGAIVGFELRVDHIDAAFKLSQNRTPEDRESVIAHLLRSDRAMDRELAAEMQRFDRRPTSDRSRTVTDSVGTPSSTDTR